MSRKPGHAKDGIVALELRCGERRRERHRLAVRHARAERVVDAHFAVSLYDRSVSEADRAVGRQERQTALAGEVGVDEVRRRAAVDQEYHRGTLVAPS